MREIIEKAQTGDSIAFQSLVEAHQMFAFRVAFRLLCHEENAHDVVQEAFIRVWKHLEKFNNRKKFSTWLYKIIVNLCYDQMRCAWHQHHQSINDDCPSFAEQTDLEENISNQDTTYLVSAHKSFFSVEKMNQELVFPDDSVAISSSAHWQKAFRWFYTFFYYSETFQTIFPFRGIPLEQEFTEQEIKWIKAGIDTSDIDDKLDNWIIKSIFIEFYTAFESYAANHPDLNISSAELKANRDSLYQRMMHYEFLETDDTSYVDYFTSQVHSI
ncbi:MAG: sigma-70 family RNA polymerase sigma factor [candidate division KSB1 bacterium]|nr:sigma-70 family RNA polymerase sigma factor [candidate division KSB1 bacterium]